LTVVTASVVLLAVGIVGTLRPPARLPNGAVPVLAAAVAIGLPLVGVGTIHLHDVLRSVRPLVAPLLFLLLATPLASMLDRLGVFEAAASLATGRRLAVGCWVLAAVTVAALNLDTAVILLTPLYVSIARRSGIDPLALAAQPAILACLASSGLPVSNLTNLIATEQGSIGAGTLVRLLGPATVAATAAGYAGWRLAFRRSVLVPTAVGQVPVGAGLVGAADDHPGRAGDGSVGRPLLVGGVVLTVLLGGFALGRVVGVPPWVVVATVDIGLLVLGARPRMSRGPVETAAAACGLAVLAAAVAGHVDVAGLMGGGVGWLAELRIIGVGAGVASLTNNLPALLVLLPAAVGDRAVAALLLGLNLGPAVIVTGSLSGLLWLDAARRAGLRVGALDYTRFGVIAGVPAIVVAAAALLVVR
jgi:arsenical pump membrane protein